jgi:hypothetical protein
MFFDANVNERHKVKVFMNTIHSKISPVKFVNPFSAKHSLCYLNNSVYPDQNAHPSASYEEL